jgi:hypothetical protein
VVGPMQSPEENLLKPNTPSFVPGQKPASKPTAEPHRPRARFQPKKTKAAWRPKSIMKPKPMQPGCSLNGPALTPQSLVPKTSLSSVPPKPAMIPAFDTCDTALVPHLGEVVTRTWGSSLDWVLELCDGRRLSIPVSLLRPYLGEFQDSGQVVPSGSGEMGCAGVASGLSDEFSSDEGDDEGESVVWADSEFSKGDGEDVPLEVLPLASVVPQEGVGVEGVSVLGEAGVDVVGSSKLGEAKSDPSPSEWVMGKYHLFGEFVGASYEGFEEEVLALLKSIDTCRTNIVSGGEVSDMSCKLGRKGSRELKVLVSTINYDSGLSRSRGSKRERVLLLSQ